MHKNTKIALAKVYGDKIPDKVSKAVEAAENALSILGGDALPAATLAALIVSEDGEPKALHAEDKAAKATKKG